MTNLSTKTRFIDSKYNQRIFRSSIAAILIGLSSINGQAYKLHTYQIALSQRPMSSDSLVLKGTRGSSFYQSGSRDPWAGYAIFNDSQTIKSIMLKPFTDSLVTVRMAFTGWELQLDIDGEKYFDHTGRIGRIEYATEGEDGYDSGDGTNTGSTSNYAGYDFTGDMK